MLIFILNVKIYIFKFSQFLTLYRPFPDKFQFKKPDEWVIPLKDKTIKEIQDKEVVFTATFSRPDEKAKWAFKGDEIFHGKQYKIELLEDESKDKTIHQLTIKKPMFKNQGKYTVTCNEVQTGAYLDVEGKINC